MLLLAARGGALAARIGPRIPMTLGPLVMAAGTLLLLRVGPDVSYARDVLPGLTVFGLGLALMVAPLTATVLAAAPDEHAGHRQRGQQRRGPGRLAARGGRAAGGGRAWAATSTPTRSPSTRRTGRRWSICAALLAAGGVDGLRPVCDAAGSGGGRCICTPRPARG